MSFPRYKAYKDSGVEWLGEVPEHWEVCRITHHLQSIVDYRGRTPQKDDFGVFLVTAKNIRDGTIDYETSQEFITEKAYQEVIQRGRPSIGDVVFTTEAPLGQVANLDRDDIALAQRVIKFSGIPRVADNYFLKYWIMGSICQSELESLATGSTALGIKGSKVNQLHFCMPPFLEQTQIAHFLDRETARIDALIAEQERLIELLKEKRQAVISHAVTKGLDPTVPMKDSGVEWLGEVPEQWEVCRITHYLKSVVDYRGRTPKKDDHGIFLVTAKNIRNGLIDYEASQEYITEEAYKEVIQRGKPEVNDVVFTTEAPLGQVANLDRNDIALAQRVIKFSGEDNILDNHFLKYWIMGNLCQSELNSLATGSTALGIKGSKINQLSFCLPPFSEQLKIVNWLGRQNKNIDALIEQAQNGVYLLQERRSALISAAVTGKIDVRGWQAPTSTSPVDC